MGYAKGDVEAALFYYRSLFSRKTPLQELIERVWAETDVTDVVVDG